MLDIKGASAIVTGGASGLGAATARALTCEGAKVVIADLNEEKGNELASELDGAFAKTDVADEAQNEAAVRTAVDAWGGVDVFAANAGLPHRTGPLVGLSTEEFDRMFAINTRSVYFGAKYAVPHMGEGSAIVSTASITARPDRSRR